MIEKIIDGYSVNRLIIVLLSFSYFDILTTYIGYNKGFFERNIIIGTFLDVHPLLAFVYPVVIILPVCIIFFILFDKWILELKVTFIFLCFRFMLAGLSNLMLILK
jgi:hypothetical protein